MLIGTSCYGISTRTCARCIRRQNPILPRIDTRREGNRPYLVVRTKCAQILCKRCNPSARFADHFVLIHERGPVDAARWICSGEGEPRLPRSPLSPGAAAVRAARTLRVLCSLFTTAESLNQLVVGTVLGVCFIAFFRQLASAVARRRWWTLGITLGIPMAHVALGLTAALVVLDRALRINGTNGTRCRSGPSVTWAYSSPAGPCSGPSAQASCPALEG